jgi:2',3'-cyclic-nucleotide 2'-phosphodiesterase/3'-nucleotidase
VTNKDGKAVPFLNAGTANVTKNVITLNGDGTFELDETGTQLPLNAGVENDAALQTVMEPYYGKAVQFVNEPIGKLSSAGGAWDNVNNFFVTQGDGYDLVNEAQLWAADADVSIASDVHRNNFFPGTLFTGDEATADISLKKMYDLYQYDNNLLYGIYMSGPELLAWMEETAKYYSINNGSVRGSGYGLDAFYGISYEVYPSEPVGQRIKNAIYKGELLAEHTAADIKVAVNSYRLSASRDNDSYGWFKATGLNTESDRVYFIAAESEKFGVVGGSVTLIIGEYIKEMGVLKPPRIESSSGSYTRWRTTVDPWSADYSRLESALAAYGALEAKADGYSADSWAALMALVTKGKAAAGTVDTLTANLIADAIMAAVDDLAATRTIMIASTTDIHGKMWDANILTGGNVSNNYLRVSTVVNGLRDTYGAQNVMVIDNGDAYQGTPISSYNILSKGGVNNPVAQSLRYIGYDAMVLGNHEFNYPWNTMNTIYNYLQSDADANGTPVSVLAANIYRQDGSNAFTPYIIRTFDVGDKTVKVGVLGLENTDCTRWDVPANYPGLRFAHPQNTNYSLAWEVDYYLNNFLKNPLSADYCDVVVVAAHSGIGNTNGDLQFGVNTESQVRRMVSETKNVDMVIAGHDHSVFNQSIKNQLGEDIPVVNGGTSRVTRVELVLTLENDTLAYTVRDIGSTNLTNSITADPVLKELVRPAVDEAVAYVSSEFGALGTGNWGTSGTSLELGQTDAMDLINRAQLWTIEQEIAKGNLQGRPAEVSATTNITSGLNLKPGNISRKDLFALYRYDNYLYVVDMTGAELKAWVEGVAQFYRANITDGEVTGYAKNGGANVTALFYGLDFTYDVSKTTNRVTNLKFSKTGQFIEDDTPVRVAVNNYLIGQAPFSNTGKSSEDAIWSSEISMGTEAGLVLEMITKFVEAQPNSTVNAAPSGWSPGYQTVEEPQYQLTVLANMGGRIVQGINGKYAQGTTIPINTVANAGYRFTGWTVLGSGAFANANNGNTTFMMPNGAATLVANFALIVEEKPIEEQPIIDPPAIPEVPAPPAPPATPGRVTRPSGTGTTTTATTGTDTITDTDDTTTGIVNPEPSNNADGSDSIGTDLPNSDVPTTNPDAEQGDEGSAWWAPLLIAILVIAALGCAWAVISARRRRVEGR